MTDVFCLSDSCDLFDLFSKWKSTVALVIVSLILEYSTILKDILISFSNTVHVLNDII